MAVRDPIGKRPIWLRVAAALPPAAGVVGGYLVGAARLHAVVAAFARAHPHAITGPPVRSLDFAARYMATGAVLGFILDAAVWAVLLVRG